MENNNQIKTQVVNCTCKKTFSIQPQEQVLFTNRGEELPKLCPRCREKQTEIYKNNLNVYEENKQKDISRLCTRCGERFVITIKEQDYIRVL